MRMFLRTLLILTVLPALPRLAAADQPSAPPPATYEVWGFRWDGQQWVKQADHSFTTTDLAQARNYVRTVNSYPGWRATSNCPVIPHGAAWGRYPHGQFNFGGVSIGGPWGAMINRAIAQASTEGGGTSDGGATSDDSAADVVSNFQSADNGDSVRLQDQLNAMQDDVNNQNMLNTQNFFNTENAINSQMMNDQQNAAAEQAQIQAMSQ